MAVPGVGLAITALVEGGLLFLGGVPAPPRSIGPLKAQVTIEERHQDEGVLTDHPVEQGAPVTDHFYNRPAELVISAGWSNNSAAAAGNDLYVAGVYQQLLSLKAAATRLTVNTGKRIYDDMVIVGLSTSTTKETEDALLIQISLRQVIIVNTQTVSLQLMSSTTANQADPGKTAQTVPLGTKTVNPVTNSQVTDPVQVIAGGLY